MAQVNVDILVNDIKETVAMYEDVAGIILQAMANEDGYIDNLGLILTFNDVEKPSLFGAMEIFSFNYEGLQALYEACRVEFSNLAVNVING